MPDPRPKIHVWRPPGVEGIDLQWCHEVVADVPSHFHEGYQVGLVEAGALDVEVAGQHSHAHAGDLVLFDAGAPHTMTGTEDHPVTAIVIEISDQRMRHFLDLRDDEAPPRFASPVVRDEAAADGLRALHRCIASKLEAERARAVAELEPLICHLMAEHGAAHPDGLDAVRAEAVDDVRRYLDEHLGERLALDDLAASVGASKFQLARCFKRRVGLPPLGYQLQRRINRAKELLATGIPIAEVALDLGFADQSHLTRHFKRITLMTPGDYQRSDRPGSA